MRREKRAPSWAQEGRGPEGTGTSGPEQRRVRRCKGGAFGAQAESGSPRGAGLFLREGGWAPGVCKEALGRGLGG